MSGGSLSPELTRVSLPDVTFDPSQVGRKADAGRSGADRTDLVMDETSRSRTSAEAIPWFGLQQQRLVAVLIAAAHLGVLVWWVSQGGLRGELIRLDEARHLECRSKFDLNECAWPELTLLPGISETMARRIVRDRSNRGEFSHVEDLCRVPGIGPKKLAQLQPFLVCRPSNDHSPTTTNLHWADEPAKKR